MFGISPNAFSGRPSRPSLSSNKDKPQEEAVQIANEVFAKKVKSKDQNVWKPSADSVKDVTSSLTWLKDYRLQSHATDKLGKEIKEPPMTQTQVDKSYKNLNKFIDEKVDSWVEEMRDMETASLESG